MARARVSLIALALLTGVCNGPTPAFAQVGAALGGFVSDDTGASLPGVTVTITNTSNGTAQVLVTGADGNYRAIGLSPAPYQVNVQLNGFAPDARTLTLTIGADAKVDFKLRVATVQETITVSGEVPLVETARSEPTSVVLADQIAALPVLDRNFLSLAQTLPRFGAADRWKHLVRVDEVRRSRRPAQRLHDAHRRRQRRRQRLGQPDRQRQPGRRPGIQGVPEPVRRAVRRRARRSRQRRDQVGHEPVRWQRILLRPRSEARCDQRVCDLQAALRSDACRRVVRRPDRHEPDALLRRGREIERQQHDARVAAGDEPFAALENGVFPTPTRERMFDLKVDHQFTSQHNAFVRYAYDNQQLGGAKKPLHDVGSGLLLGTNSTDSAIQAHSTVVQDNWAASDHAMNSFRVHYFKDYLATLPNSETLGVVRPSFTWGQSSISPQIFDRWDVALNETLFLNVGRHDLKVGVDVARDDFPFEAHFNEKGVFTFTTDLPFDVSNSRTYPTSFTMQLPGFYDYKSTQIASYVQDEWQVRPRLHVNAGLRFDVDTNMRINQFYTDLLKESVLRAARPVPRPGRRGHVHDHAAASARCRVRPQRQRIVGAPGRVGPGTRRATARGSTRGR